MPHDEVSFLYIASAASRGKTVLGKSRCRATRRGAKIKLGFLTRRRLNRRRSWGGMRKIGDGARTTFSGSGSVWKGVRTATRCAGAGWMTLAWLRWQYGQCDSSLAELWECKSAAVTAASARNAISTREICKTRNVFVGRIYICPGHTRTAATILAECKR